MKRNKQFVLIEAMDAMAREGWCVVLKRLPPQLGWILEGSRSEYDDPAPDQIVGRDMWCAEATFMGDGPYRHSQFSMQESPYQAIKHVRDRCREADTKARKAMEPA